MKFPQTLIFFGIILFVYGLINFYIIRRLLSAIPENFKSLVLIVSIFVILSFIAGRLLENIWISYVSDFLIWIGSFWLAIMFYSFLCLVIIDLVRAVNFFVPFFPSVITRDPEKTKRVLLIVVSILVFITVAGGFINTKIINVRQYWMPIHKKAANLKTLNIVMASDLHLGTINGKNFAYRVAWDINHLNPDIILLAGDIIDEDIKPVLRDNVGEALFELKAKYGIYGITGNHEYIGGVEEAVKYLNAHNIQMLRDSTIKIADSFYVVGREDRSASSFGGNGRKSLEELTKDIDKSLPVILMDHQPFHLEEAQQCGIDLQLSGHTHNGQLWPLNYLINKIYDIGWGYRLIGNTHYYVSCGVGGWGPPVRTGSIPEIINIHLRFIK